MAIEIVDLPSWKMVIFRSYVNVYQAGYLVLSSIIGTTKPRRLWSISHATSYQVNHSNDIIRKLHQLELSAQLHWWNSRKCMQHMKLQILHVDHERCICILSVCSRCYWSGFVWKCGTTPHSKGLSSCFLCKGSCWKYILRFQTPKCHIKILG